MHSLNLTIAIPVRNEQRNLPGCLDSIGAEFARHVVVLDSGSTDGTQKIATDWGAEVLDFKWNGQFPKKRNWYLQNHRPATKWILFLDADEYLTNDFKNELRHVLAESENVGYWLNYTVFFLGKNLKGGYPLKKLALFRVGAGEYERIDEAQWSQLDMEVHEHPVLSGPVGQIKSKIDHQDFRGTFHYISKHNDYSTWEANRFLKASEMLDVTGKWTWKQRIKYRLIRTPWIGVVYFFGSYLGMGGFKDGARGLAFAILKMSYFTQIYCKIKELESRGQNH